MALKARREQRRIVGIHRYEGREGYTHTSTAYQPPFGSPTVAPRQVGLGCSTVDRALHRREGCASESQ